MKSVSDQKSLPSKKEAPTDSVVVPNTILELILPWEKIDTAFQKVVRKYQPQVKSSGFRKGKAPASLVIQMVGKGKLFDEALEVILPVAYTELVEAKKLNPIGLPAIKLLESAEEKDWKLEVQIAERPELKLGEYKKIISDAKKDLEKDKESKQKTEKSKKENLEVLDEKARQKVEAEEKNHKLNAVLQQLVIKLKPKVPQLLIEQEAQRSLQELQSQLQRLNIEADAYLKSLGKNLEEMQQEYLSRALGTWQVELILSAIAEDQKLSVPEEEVEKIAHAQPGSHLDHSSVRSVLLKQKVLDFLLEV